MCNFTIGARRQRDLTSGLKFRGFFFAARELILMNGKEGVREMKNDEFELVDKRTRGGIAVVGVAIRRVAFPFSRLRTYIQFDS